MIEKWDSIIKCFFFLGIWKNESVWQSFGTKNQLSQRIHTWLAISSRFCPSCFNASAYSPVISRLPIAFVRALPYIIENSNYQLTPGRN
jgi:hypothetical protein